MYHCMTVWTKGNHILNRVYYIVLTYCMQWFDMMNVYKSFTVFAIDFLKVKPTTLARSTVMVNTHLPCFWITLIGVYCNLLFAPSA